MGKLTYEQAVTNQETATAARKAARAAIDKLCTDNKLNPKKDHSEHEKIGKEFKKLRKEWKAAKETEEKAMAAAKELKPKSERNSKYEYPDDCVSEGDKKKFRAKQRAASKPKKEKEEKPAGEEKAPKKDKKAKKEEAPAVEEKTSGKKDKKKKKEKVEEED